MKKKPQRTCIGCNVQKDKNDFVRIVKSKEGNITIRQEKQVVEEHIFVTM